MSVNLTFTIPPSRQVMPPPFTQGGSSPPDSTPKRCNTLYLASKEREKEYEQNCPYSFCRRAGACSRRFINFLLFVSAAPKHALQDFSRQNQLYRRCANSVRPRRVICTSCVGSDMRFARLKRQRRIEYHLRPAGAISLLRSKNITPSCARHIA